MRSRTRIGIDVSHHFRLSNRANEWRWIALEVSFRNASDRPVSLVEYGLIVCHPDGTVTTAHPIHYSELPNGDSILEDPVSRERTAVEAHLDFIETPVNLAPRSSATGWVAFYLSETITDQAADEHPMSLFVVDQDRATWQLRSLHLGKSKPWRSGRSTIIARR